MREERKTDKSLKLILKDLTYLYDEAINIEADLELNNSMSRSIAAAEDHAISNLDSYELYKKIKRRNK